MRLRPHRGALQRLAMRFCSAQRRLSSGCSATLQGAGGLVIRMQCTLQRAASLVIRMQCHSAARSMACHPDAVHSAARSVACHPDAVPLCSAQCGLSSGCSATLQRAAWLVIRMQCHSAARSVACHPDAVPLCSAQRRLSSGCSATLQRTVDHGTGSQCGAAARSGLSRECQCPAARDRPRADARRRRDHDDRGLHPAAAWTGRRGDRAGRDGPPAWRLRPCAGCTGPGRAGR
jgi:hypothetical protein